MTDPAAWLAAAVAVVFLGAAVAPAAVSLVGAARSLPIVARTGKGLQAVVVVVALFSVARARPGRAEVPPPMVRLEYLAPAPLSSPTDPATVYVVQTGDSLWRIAHRHLEAALGAPPRSVEIDRFWRQIYEQNREVIGADPDLIFPEQRFQIPKR